MEFPIFKTKIEGAPQKFDLNNPKEREKYFNLKAGTEIKKIKDFLKNNTFIAYLLGKKNSGKGTYSKMLAEIVGNDKVTHFSIGDMIRNLDEELKDEKNKKELVSFLERNYRGNFSLEEIIKNLEQRSTKTLLPTELILTLAKREIAKKGKKAIFIDGFPRGLDQINFALFFRDLIGYRDDPDVFILLDVPESVIDERIKWRRICPLCKTSRNLKLLPTSKISYNEDKKEFRLICDNPDCQEIEMVSKEGDELGISPIRERLELDERLINQAISLYGIPKILLRNSIPTNVSKEYVDDYEITPEYEYQWDEKNQKVVIIEKPWVINNDLGVPSVSLLAPPVVVSMIKQMVDIFGL